MSATKGRWKPPSSAYWRTRPGCTVGRSSQSRSSASASTTSFPTAPCETCSRRGFWEAKDTDDDLTAEISKKIAKGYPTVNTIFEDTRRAILFQGGKERYQFDLTDKKQVAALLNEFYAYTEPEIDNFHQAVDEFKSRVPELAQGLVKILTEAHKDNKKMPFRASAPKPLLGSSPKSNSWKKVCSHRNARR